MNNKASGDILPETTVLSHLIQGKGVAAALKFMVRFSVVLFSTNLTRCHNSTKQILVYLSPDKWW